MKVLAIEREIPGVSDVRIKQLLKAEALRVWELQQSDVIREIYFRRDWSGAVLVLECLDINEANEVIASLPLVSQGLITFEVIPLGPYPGYERLFYQS